MNFTEQHHLGHEKPITSDQLNSFAFQIFKNFLPGLHLPMDAYVNSFSLKAANSFKKNTLGTYEPRGRAIDVRANDDLTLGTCLHEFAHSWQHQVGHREEVNIGNCLAALCSSQGVELIETAVGTTVLEGMAEFMAIVGWNSFNNSPTVRKLVAKDSGARQVMADSKKNLNAREQSLLLNDQEYLRALAELEVLINLQETVNGIVDICRGVPVIGACLISIILWRLIKQRKYLADEPFLIYKIGYSFMKKIEKSAQNNQLLVGVWLDGLVHCLPTTINDLKNPQLFYQDKLLPSLNQTPNR